MAGGSSHTVVAQYENAVPSIQRRLRERNHSCSTRFASRHLLAGKMVDLIPGSLGVVLVIGLIATITALTVQRFVGTSATSVLVGPFIAAALVIIYTKCRSAK